MSSSVGSPPAPSAASAQRTTDAEDPTVAVDAFIESYVCWREQCAEVQSAYDRWTRGQQESSVSFAIYSAELEFEEDAARAYRRSAERLALAALQAAQGRC